MERDSCKMPISDALTHLDGDPHEPGYITLITLSAIPQFVLAPTDNLFYETAGLALAAAASIRNQDV